MPWTKCPACGDQAGFMPKLVDPHTGQEMTLEAWYQRVSAHFQVDVTVDTVLPFYCEGCALDKGAVL